MPSVAKNSATEYFKIPLLPLKDAVIFPNMVVPLLVGRPQSLAAVQEALTTQQPIFLCTQKDGQEEEPGARDMYRVGVAANILQTLRMPDGTMKVVVEGLGRARVKRFTMNEPVMVAQVEKIEPSLRPLTKKQSAVLRTALSQFEEYTRLNQRIAHEVVNTVQSLAEPDVAADTMCAYLPLKVEERQELLEILQPVKRLERISALLMREIELMQIEQDVRDRVRDQIERGQREHYLQEQLKAIHQELGNREEGVDEYTEMRALIDKTWMPKDVKAKAKQEMLRYERMPQLSPESSVVRSYLEWLVEVPWKKRTKDSIDLKKAKEVLDGDHYGLEKVKERILEFLAVRKLSKNTKGPILCLVGPPGVGKTSLGTSIAEAMGRKFVRVSLGGIRDESEIRGHRRTYIGALPGRIIQSMKKVGVKNPLFMLDEIDKMSNDFKGDPASALLEVLDPAQNTHFSDHFMEVDYDLSEVFFIATANSEYDIPYALHDRMEIVRLPGYTMLEKAAIAKQFLLPRQLKSSGLKPGQISLTKDGLDRVLQRYTSEAGVRELERQLAALCRKVARKVVEGKLKKGMKINAAKVEDLLGPPIYSEIKEEAEAHVGVAIGMAWTQVGGDVLTIETSVLKGKGNLELSGQLGDVMVESGEAAYTWLRANAKALRIPTEFHKSADIHVHVPEGATPKDGPSAGVALVVSMLSALRGKAPRAALSMTGEVTLRGRVLPVGGIKEKVIAAHRAGMKDIILPKDNQKDLPDIPKEVQNDVNFHFVEHVDEVIALAFPRARRAKKRT